jgi:hypothetical protein
MPSFPLSKPARTELLAALRARYDQATRADKYHPKRVRGPEARPTHRSKPSSPRTYRTRVDPFAGVWTEILGWLQSEPDATARVLMDRLQSETPDRFPDGQLRTLQRRVKEWRQMMARELVQGTSGMAGPAIGGVKPRKEGTKTAGEVMGIAVLGR